MMEVFTARAPLKLANGAFINLDPNLFALCPGSRANKARVMAETAAAVETFVDNEPGALKWGALAKLVRLRFEGKMLWPLASLFKQKPLGYVHSHEFYTQLRAMDFDPEDVNRNIENSSYFRLKGYTKNNNVRDYVRRIVLAILMSSTDTVRGIDDIDRHRMDEIIDLCRPDNGWAEWVNYPIRRGVRWADLCVAHRDGSMESARRSSERPKDASYRPRSAELAKLPKFGWFSELYEEWLDTRHSRTKKHARYGKDLFIDYIESLALPSTTMALCFDRDVIKGLSSFALNWRSAFARPLAVSKLNELADWIRLEIEDGRQNLKELPFYSHDQKSFSSRLPRGLNSSRAEVSARPMPQKFIEQIKSIITDDDFAWPKSIMDNADGVKKYYATVRDAKTRKLKHIFCPVIPRLVLLALQLPGRGVQMRRLDSGEGDDLMWDPGDNSWSANTGPNARYWSRGNAINSRRGVFRKIELHDGGSMVGIYINSNKNNDYELMFGEESGYVIPWEHREALENLAALRAWQERYNPVKAPLAYRNIPKGIFKDEPSASVRAKLPAHFYLFRDPQNSGACGNEAPPTHARVQQFFLHCIAELQRRLREEDPSTPVTLITRWTGSLPKMSIYSFHGLRSSWITAQVQAGTPVEMIGKVTGHHAVLVMLSYAKFEPRHVSEVLTASMRRILAEETSKFHDALGNAAFEHRMRLTARSETLDQENSLRDLPDVGAWSRMDHGICPNGGTLCHVGGRCLHRRIVGGVDKSRYGPVPGGRTCVRCRFFVTGLPYLVPLWLYASSVMAGVNAEASRVEQFEAEENELKVLRLALSKRGEALPPEARERLAKVEELKFAAAEKRDDAALTLHAALVLLDKVRPLAEEANPSEGTHGLSMLAPAGGVPRVVGVESTRFAVIDQVLQASRVFPSLHSEDMERERDIMLDRVRILNGKKPLIMVPLTRDEKIRSNDATATFLATATKVEEMEQVLSGGITLADLGLGDAFDRVSHAFGPDSGAIEAWGVSVRELGRRK